MTAFRRDRMFALAFACLSVCALSPLFATPLLPFPDLPTNVASGALLVKAILGNADVLRYYRVDWLPFPYWIPYLFYGIGTLAFGPFAAAKLLAGIIVIAWPLSLLRLAIALRRDARLSLCGFLFCWDHNMQAGWHAYAAGMVLALVIVARMIEAPDRRAAARIAPWSLVLALTHPIPLSFVLLSAVLLVCGDERPLARLKLHSIAVSGAAVVMVPSLVRMLQRSGNGRPFALEFPSPSEKIVRFFEFSLDVLRGSAVETFGALALAFFLFSPLAFQAVNTGVAAASSDRRLRWAGALVPLAFFMLYAGMPMAIYGPIEHWYTYPRFASYLLASLLLVPPVATAPFVVVASGTILAAGFNLTTMLAFRSFGRRAAPFTEMLDVVTPGSRLLPLEYVDGDDVTRMSALAHVHSYLTAKGLYDPHLFDNPMTPIRYRSDLSIPRIPWLGPRDFSLERYAPHYDFILVQGSTHDPLADGREEGQYRVRLVREAGMWRLYAVESK